jgi:RHS repeat-associated protein
MAMSEPAAKQKTGVISPLAAPLPENGFVCSNPSHSQATPPGLGSFRQLPPSPIGFVCSNLAANSRPGLEPKNKTHISLWTFVSSTPHCAWPFCSYETASARLVQRYYNSNAGRFYTPDPSGMAAVDVANPTSWNMYGYVNDDPVNFSDPRGLIGDCPVGTRPAGSGFNMSCVGDSSPGAGGGGGSSGHESPIPTGNPGLKLPGGFGGVPVRTKASSPCANLAYAQARAFVGANEAAADQIASQLNTTAADILGLAAFESGWGSGPLIAAGTNNYFSLTAGPAFGGTIGTGKNTFGVYPSPGFLSSGESFANSYFGTQVNGITNALAFAEALNANGNYNSENLPTPYVISVSNTINLAAKLLSCQ